MAQKINIFLNKPYCFRKSVLKKTGYSILFLLLFLFKCTRNLTPDYVWIYQCGNLAREGLFPYRDYNTFVPPFAILYDTVMCLPIHTVYNLKILSLVPFVVSSVLLYQKKRPLLFLEMLFSFYMASPEYNYTCYVLFLGLHLFFLKKEKFSTWDILFASLLCFFGTGIKISFGLMLTVAAYITLLYGGTIKEAIRTTAVFLIVFLTGTGLVMGFFYAHHALPDLINQCIIPLVSHAKNSPPGTVAVCSVTCIVVPLSILFVLYIKNKRKAGRSVLFAFLGTVLGIINLIPTYNFYHFLILDGILLVLVGELIFSEKDFVKKYEILFICMFSVTVFIGTSGSGKSGVDSSNDYVTEKSTGKSYKCYFGDYLNHATAYAREHPDALYVSGMAQMMQYFEDLPYEKYDYFLIDGNIGTKDPAELLEESAYRYFIFPSDENICSYECLLDSRIHDYMKGKEKTGEIYDSGGTMIYEVYRK